MRYFYKQSREHLVESGMPGLMRPRSTAALIRCPNKLCFELQRICINDSFGDVHQPHNSKTDNHIGDGKSSVATNLSVGYEPNVYRRIDHHTAWARRTSIFAYSQGPHTIWKHWPIVAFEAWSTSTAMPYLPSRQMTANQSINHLKSLWDLAWSHQTVADGASELICEEFRKSDGVIWYALYMSIDMELHG